jgi:hypothetical protein
MWFSNIFQPVCFDSLSYSFLGLPPVAATATAIDFTDVFPRSNLRRDGRDGRTNGDGSGVTFLAT